MTLAFKPSTTAFLFMDFQTGIVMRIADQAEGLLQRTRTVLDAARTSGAFVGFVRVAFRPGFPEISRSQPVVRPGEGERRDAAGPARDRHRLGRGAAGERESRSSSSTAWARSSGPDYFETLLRARRVETLVLLGIATSGVVLSTLRYAADMDYRIVVASDGCADMDPEVHRVLMEKCFPAGHGHDHHGDRHSAARYVRRGVGIWGSVRVVRFRRWVIFRRTRGFAAPISCGAGLRPRPRCDEASERSIRRDEVTWPECHHSIRDTEVAAGGPHHS